MYAKDCLVFLRESIISCMNQSVPCDLYLYVDGVVREEVVEYLVALESQRNVYVFWSGECRGLAVGLNFLIEKVVEESYPFVARMDSDDIARANRISEQLKFMELNSDVDVCGAFAREFGAPFALEVKRLPLIHEELYDFSITRCPFIHPTVIFRAKVFRDGFRYPENSHFTEDMALWYLLLKNGFKFGNVNQVLLDYRISSATLKRRLGFRKSWSEARMRAIYMISLNRFSLRNLLLLVVRFLWHLSPRSVATIGYRFRNRI
ncbi:glycosyltransferase [Sulfitobacter sp. 915]|uniref:glycosyltransferase n=1 Tax=Sulfitobacter sp. 915 TaxID=3368558 RepID=UPI003745AFBC